MFGKIIKADDLSFLENDSFRNIFKEDTIKNIVDLFKEFKSKHNTNRAIDTVYINYDINDKNEYLFYIKLGYSSTTIFIKSSINEMLNRMYNILKEMDLIFQVCSNSEGVNIETEHDYSLCTFSKTENRKMFNTGLRLPAIKKKEIFVESQMHTHIALLIYNMFGDIANELVKFNNGNSVKIFYGDIDFAFKDWVDS